MFGKFLANLDMLAAEKMLKQIMVKNNLKSLLIQYEPETEKVEIIYSEDKLKKITENDFKETIKKLTEK